jgi:hypothetical protein
MMRLKKNDDVLQKKKKKKKKTSSSPDDFFAIRTGKVAFLNKARSVLLKCLDL